MMNIHKALRLTMATFLILASIQVRAGDDVTRAREEIDSLKKELKANEATLNSEEKLVILSSKGINAELTPANLELVERNFKEGGQFLINSTYTKEEANNHVLAIHRKELEEAKAKGDADGEQRALRWIEHIEKDQPYDAQAREPKWITIKSPADEQAALDYLKTNWSHEIRITRIRTKESLALGERNSEIKSRFRNFEQGRTLALRDVRNTVARGVVGTAIIVGTVAAVGYVVKHEDAGDSAAIVPDAPRE
jgi:hypothetical protein